MSLTIPIWLWIAAKCLAIVVGIAASLAVLFLAYMGLMFIQALARGPFWR